MSQPDDETQKDEPTEDGAEQQDLPSDVDPGQEALLESGEEGEPLTRESVEAEREEAVMSNGSAWKDGPPFGTINRVAPDPPPQETTLHNSVTDFTRLADGGMLLHFTPVLLVGEGAVVGSPTYTVEFDATSWEIFKRRCEKDGAMPLIRPRPMIHIPDSREGFLHG